MGIKLTALHGAANQSPLQISVPVQFSLVLYLFAESHFTSSTITIPSFPEVPQKTFLVLIPGPHFDEHYKN